MVIRVQKKIILLINFQFFPFSDKEKSLPTAGAQQPIYG